jgi:uncharacterized protein (DUF1499 family)
MPIYLWLGTFCIIALCVFRFWPVSVPDINSDIFTADDRSKPNYYASNPTEGQFAVSAIELHSALMKQLSKSPRLKAMSSSNEDGFYAIYVERSFAFGFPDFLSIKIEEKTHNRTVITLFSKSKFGYSDLGVNRKRIKKLLAGLRQQLGT